MVICLIQNQRTDYQGQILIGPVQIFGHVFKQLFVTLVLANDFGPDVKLCDGRRRVLNRTGLEDDDETGVVQKGIVVGSVHFPKTYVVVTGIVQILQGDFDIAVIGGIGVF